MKPTESLPILHIFPTLFIYFFLKEKNNIYETLYLFFLDFILFKKGLKDRLFIALIVKQKNLISTLC